MISPCVLKVHGASAFTLNALIQGVNGCERDGDDGE